MEHIVWTVSRNLGGIWEWHSRALQSTAQQMYKRKPFVTPRSTNASAGDENAIGQAHADSKKQCTGSAPLPRPSASFPLAPKQNNGGIGGASCSQAVPATAAAAVATELTHPTASTQSKVYFRVLYVKQVKTGKIAIFTLAKVLERHCLQACSKP